MIVIQKEILNNEHILSWNSFTDHMSQFQSVKLLKTVVT